MLAEWLERAGLTLTTLRAFARGDMVVLEQRGVWHHPESGAITGDKVLASAFRVNPAGQVAWFARFDQLGEALAAAGIDEQDEVHSGTSIQGARDD